MADNQSGKKKSKKKRKSYIKDGVVLKVSDIEKECDRLRRRPRAALYPLLPITEPLKLKRKSIHIQKGRRRHRKHCRKRLHQVGIEKRRPPVSRGLSSRTRLVTTTTTSGSEVSSLACSRTRDLLALHNQKGSLNKPHWASAELFCGDCSFDLPRTSFGGFEHPRHHHYHHKKMKHRICHHDPLLIGHRTSVTTSLKDLRGHVGRHHRRCLDPEAGLGDRESTSSNSRSRKIVSFIVASVASFILMMCVALVAVTLRLTPAIDELGKYYSQSITHLVGTLLLSLR
ncbi:uncharacterized protein TNIN_171111 [Trichonephila inaurata madagascariensis]|uniref:Uncharacterized protein n=1 Tax=Trichonephila inaurata madagascariensis TaxID=2747483 RepID=A0A8X7CC19_9ARAC|nr:uncharacterized protein TNIN_171111 [Trichonephila inaurata madagascariensis]